MIIYHNYIPPDHYVFLTKNAQIVPEQMLNENVSVYEEAVPYIICEIKNTIQHESGHRKDEESRYDDIYKGNNTIPFNQFIDENRAEPIAKREEIGCQQPSNFSGKTKTINLNQIFQEAKNSANIKPQYRNDIKAGTLEETAQGQYLMQDVPQEFLVKRTPNNHTYEGFDGSLWIDVRKIIKPFLTNHSQNIQPATYQDDGINKDKPGVSRTPPIANSVSTPATNAIPSVSGVPARGTI